MDFIQWREKRIQRVIDEFPTMNRERLRNQPGRWEEEWGKFQEWKADVLEIVSASKNLSDDEIETEWNEEHIIQSRRSIEEFQNAPLTGAAASFVGMANTLGSDEFENHRKNFERELGASKHADHFRRPAVRKAVTKGSSGCMIIFAFLSGTVLLLSFGIYSSIN